MIGCAEKGDLCRRFYSRLIRRARKGITRMDALYSDPHVLHGSLHVIRPYVSGTPVHLLLTSRLY